MDVKELTQLTIGEVYAHSVPLKASGVAQKLSDIPSQLDATQRDSLKTNLVDSIKHRCLEIQFRAKTDPADAESVNVEELISSVLRDKKTDFKAVSRKLAEHLYNNQPGNSSDGLALFAKATCGSQAAFVILKTDNETQITSKYEVDNNGQGRFVFAEMETLNIRKNNVFKAVVFRATTAVDGSFGVDAIGSDNQVKGSDSKTMADFFLNRFLQCTYVRTQDEMLDSATEALLRQIEKIEKIPERLDVMAALSAQMKPGAVFDTDVFIDNEVPDDLQSKFFAGLKRAGVQATQFTVSEEAPNRLKFLSVTLGSGIRVIGPEETLTQLIDTDVDSGEPQLDLKGIVIDYKARKTMR